MKHYIITFSEEGRVMGGRYRDEAHALEVNSLFGKVIKIVEGNMRDLWRRRLNAEEAV